MELSLIDKLREIADAKPGAPMPSCLRVPVVPAGSIPGGTGVTIYTGVNDWGRPLSEIARQAVEALEQAAPLRANFETLQRIITGLRDAHAVEASSDPAFPVTIDHGSRMITICGIRYSWTLFEELGGAMLGTVFEITSRGDGTVTLKSRNDVVWQDIDTAPVEPYDLERNNTYRFRCFLQIPAHHPSAKPYVCEGWAYWVPPRGKGAPILRWANSMGQCSPSAWMPMPEPSHEYARSKD